MVWKLGQRLCPNFFVFMQACARKTMNFLYNEAIVIQLCLAKALSHTTEILIGKILKD